MDRKPEEDTVTCSLSEKNKWIFGSNMKRSFSELNLEEFLKPVIESENEDRSMKEERNGGFRVQRARVCSETNGIVVIDGEDEGFDDVCAGDLGFSFRDRDMLDDFSSCDGLSEYLVWTALTPKHSSISATIDSQLSICDPASSGLTFGWTGPGSTGSPASAHKPKSTDNQARGATSGSSGDQSDDDDLELEAGSCEQSTDHTDIKRIRRMVSNRESARRSRRRKEAHMAGLESQVDHLRGENASLYKQFTDASQQFNEATTDNRVLKSNVENLRVKVKLAEEMVAQGSLTCSLNHLLQSHSVSTQPLNTHHPRRVSNVSPTIAVRGDEASYVGMSASGQISTLGLENGDTHNGNIKNRLNRSPPPLQRIASLEHLQNRIVSEAVSCMSDIWPPELHVSPVSRQI
ncbi:hypothetical protein HHK36_026155 [Tetracentron sinense]|uniref:BZIP domain-containing protein n=1 Tax=Tetracentron sinense TaxID=13715 RepID=A0A834YMG7_TETSI|nr:hypothetical protein HHK36_026155 [Tetracentron sinense]